MRFLTVFSSILLVGAGAFCFAFYMNGYAGVALVLGAATLLCGLFHAIAYFIGFRKGKLPETVLVEGFADMVLGFLIVINLVPELQINIYFGTWALVMGFIRVSESLAVSKVNPKNWFAVMPLGVVLAMAGFVMMNPSLIASFDTVYVIAVTYIINALSMFLYSMYMLKREQSQKQQEAKERADAKKRDAEARRKERDRIRSLSQTERAAERAMARQEKVQKDEEKRIAKQARKEARRPASERTLEFTPEETAEIIQLAKEPVQVEKEFVPVDEEKRPVINLEKIEEKIPEIELPTVELPKVELKAAGGESQKRKDILLELEDETPRRENPEDLASFTPLTLEELFADERFNIKPLTDQRATETDLKLTQTFTFDWLNTKK